MATQIINPAAYQDEYVSGREIASILRITERRVQQLVNDGFPKLEYNKYPLMACIHFYIDCLHHKIQENCSDTIIAEKIKLYRARADMMVAANAQFNGRFLDIEIAKQQVIAMVQIFKDGLLGLPGRFCHDFSQMRAEEIKALLTSEIHIAIRDIAEKLYGLSFNKSGSDGTTNTPVPVGGGMGCQESNTSTRVS